MKFKNQLRDKNILVKISFKETKSNFSNWLIFFSWERINWRLLQFFLHEMLFNFILAGNLWGSLTKIFAQNVARGNSVQIGPDFPAKSLSLIFKDLIGNYLINELVIIENSKPIKYFVKYGTFVVLLSEHWKTIKLCFIYLLLITRGQEPFLINNI